MVFIGHFEFLVGDQKMSSAWLYHHRDRENALVPAAGGI